MKGDAYEIWAWRVCLSASWAMSGRLFTSGYWLPWQPVVMPRADLWWTALSTLSLATSTPLAVHVHPSQKRMANHEGII